MVDPTSSGDATVEPAWLTNEPPSALRWKTMISLAWKLARHNRQQTMAAVLGIAFASLLIGQNAASTGHFLANSTVYADHTGAHLWIVPPGEKGFGFPGTQIPIAALHEARVTRGVEWAQPIIRGSSAIKAPDGAGASVLVVGVHAPEFRGGPFNIVRGDTSALLKPNALFIDDADRERLGGLNLGSSVELNGRRARVEGMTWGLVYVGGSFVFTEYDFARSILEIDSDRCSLVMVGLDHTVDPLQVKKELSARVPEAVVLTAEENQALSRHAMLFETGLIGMVAMGAFVGLVVGLAVVTLAMLSAVQHNIREFGTLKAMGATNADLRRVILVQAVGFSLAGSFLGAVALCEVAWASRTAMLNMVLDPLALLCLVPGGALIAIVSALVALRQVATVEPASVFR